LPGDLALAEADGGGGQKLDDVEALVEGGGAVAVRIGVNVGDLCRSCVSVVWATWDCGCERSGPNRPGRLSRLAQVAGLAKRGGAGGTA
jgi:hypothetical protein